MTAIQDLDDGNVVDQICSGHCNWGSPVHRGTGLPPGSGETPNSALLFYFIFVFKQFSPACTDFPSLGTPPLCAGRGVAWGEFLSHHIILILSSFGIVDIISFSSNLYDFCPFEIKQTPGEQSSQCLCLHLANLGSLGS